MLTVKGGQTTPKNKKSLSGIEIEQRYLFSRNRSANSADKDVSGILKHGLSIREKRLRQALSSFTLVEAVPYTGVDHCIHMSSNEEAYMFRYRVGTPSDHLLGIKVQSLQQRGFVKTELEIPIVPGTDEDHVISFMKVLAKAVPDASKCFAIKTEGTTYHVHGYGGGGVIEIPIGFFSCNNVTCLIGEIEAKGFKTKASAEAAICEFEELLGWEKNKNNSSKFHLLDIYSNYL